MHYYSGLVQVPQLETSWSGYIALVCFSIVDFLRTDCIIPPCFAPLVVPSIATDLHGVRIVLFHSSKTCLMGGKELRQPFPSFHRVSSCSGLRRSQL